MKPARKVIDLNLAGRQDEDAPRRGAVPSFGQAVEEFRNAIAGAGLGRPEIVLDGKLHRFDLLDEPTSKRKGSGWYVFYADNIPAGSFGSWAQGGISVSWCSRQNFEMSEVELEAVRERQRQASEAREAERERMAQDAARIATEMWAETPDADPSHPYLSRKQVRAFGVKAKDGRGALLVPMYNSRAEIIGLQRIFPDGTKRFLTGQKKEGAFHVIDGDRSLIYLCEGYATGASLHMATGQAVVVAFDAGNLEHVARAIREVFPQAKFVLAADNDRWTTRPDGSPWNVGVEKAKAVAAEQGMQIIVPEFRDLSTNPTDFNDLHVLEGLDAVRARAKGYSVRITDWSLSRLNGKTAPVREWLVEDVLPLGSAMILAAPGGTGKGMLTLNLAIKIASGQPAGISLDPSSSFFGHALASYGPVVMLAAEDDMDEIHRRSENLCSKFPENLYALCLPDMDKPRAIITSHKGTLSTTSFWEEIAEQVMAIRPKLVIIDPLSCFVLADLNDRNVGAFAMGTFTCLARQSGAHVLGVHHMNKLKDKVKNLDEARNAITGSAGFVDHGRGAYALWPEEEQKAKTLCKHLGIEYSRSRVVRGGLAKANFPGDVEEKVFIRNEFGLLVPMDCEAKNIKRREEYRLMDLLVAAIAKAAEGGHPFQHTGKAGLYEMRERLPQDLKSIGRDKLEFLARRLLDDKKIGKHRPMRGGKSEVWLDVPNGSFAMGLGELAIGYFDDTDQEKRP